MKILAFADLHSSITSLKRVEKKIKTEKPDVIFCLGDFTIFEQNIEHVMRRIDDFKIPTYVLHEEKCFPEVEIRKNRLKPSEIDNNTIAVEPHISPAKIIRHAKYDVRFCFFLSKYGRGYSSCDKNEKN